MSETCLKIDIRKQLAHFQLQVDLTVPSRGVTALYGESGSGKTTLLRCIAGLEKTKGRVSLNGEIWQDESTFVTPEQRDVGYVFQDGRLFPHLSVKENLEFAVSRTPSHSQTIQLEQVIDWMNLSDLLERSVSRLSGGEKQRVAIARALASSPKLLLMDEPLSSLDSKNKQMILPYLESLHSTLSIPIIYVSHSMMEVSRLADHLVMMSQGKITKSGLLQHVLAEPNLTFHYGDQAGVVIVATVCERDADNHLVCVEFSGGRLWLKDQGESLGAVVRIRLLASDLSLSLHPQEDQSIINSLSGRVDAVFDGEHPAVKLVRVNVGGEYVLASVTEKSLTRLAIQVGQTIWVQIKSVAVLG